MTNPDKKRVSFALRKKTKEKLDRMMKEMRKKTGENYNYPDFVDQIINSVDIEKVEQSILNGEIDGNKFDISIKFDRRNQK